MINKVKFFLLSIVVITIMLSFLLLVVIVVRHNTAPNPDSGTEEYISRECYREFRERVVYVKTIRERFLKQEWITHCEPRKDIWITVHEVIEYIWKPLNPK